MSASPKIIDQMMADYRQSSQIEEFEPSLNQSQMTKKYQSTTTGLCQTRLNAYLHGEQKKFLSQPANKVFCKLCGICSFHLGDEITECNQCHLSLIIVIPVTMCDIPPWLDIGETFWTDRADVAKITQRVEWDRSPMKMLFDDLDKPHRSQLF